jgi:DNA-binding transcriptional regulator YiaG
MNNGSVEGVRKRSPGPGLIKSMRVLRDSLQNGDCLPEQFTMRTVKLLLEPREFSAEEVQRVRTNLKASQGVFAKLLGVSIKTVQAWEQGGTPPPPMARRLLDTIQSDPAPWQEKLREAASVV